MTWKLRVEPSPVPSPKPTQQAYAVALEDEAGPEKIEVTVLVLGGDGIEQRAKTRAKELVRNFLFSV